MSSYVVILRAAKLVEGKMVLILGFGSGMRCFKRSLGTCLFHMYEKTKVVSSLIT